MFIYNVTTKVANEISAAWLQWLQEVHVPEVMATECFIKATIVRLLEIDDSEGPTYAIQYLTESKGLYNHYIEKHAGILRQRSFDKWGDRFISFRSIMQVIE